MLSVQPSAPSFLVLPAGRGLAEALLRLTVSPARARSAARCRTGPCGAGLSADEAEPLRALPLLLRRAGGGRDRLTLLCADSARRLLREETQALHPQDAVTRVAGRLACSAAVAGSAFALAVRTPRDFEVPVPGDADLHAALRDAMAALGVTLAGYCVLGPGGRVRSYS